MWPLSCDHPSKSFPGDHPIYKIFHASPTETHSLLRRLYTIIATSHRIIIDQPATSRRRRHVPVLRIIVTSPAHNHIDNARGPSEAEQRHCHNLPLPPTTSARQAVSVHRARRLSIDPSTRAVRYERHDGRCFHISPSAVLLLMLCSLSVSLCRVLGHSARPTRRSRTQFKAEQFGQQQNIVPSACFLFLLMSPPVVLNVLSQSLVGPSCTLLLFLRAAMVGMTMVAPWPLVSHACRRNLLYTWPLAGNRIIVLSRIDQSRQATENNLYPIMEQKVTAMMSGEVK